MATPPKKPASLVILAGRSDNFIEIGGISIMMAPLTMSEYVQYLALADNITVEQQAEWLAEKLRARIAQPTKDSPDIITAQWVLDNIPMVHVPTIRHILINGELPDDVQVKR